MVPWELKHERNLILPVVVNEALQEGGIYGCTWMKIIDTLHLTGKEEAEVFQAEVAHQHSFGEVQVDTYGQW